MAVAYLAAFATAVFYGVSAVVEDIAAKSVPASGCAVRRSAARTALSPLYVFGMGLSVVAWGSSLVALHSLPLFAVQAMAASSIGVVVLITWARTGHAPSRYEAALLIGMGVGLVALAVTAADGHALHTGWLFRAVIWVAVVVVVWVAVRVSHVRGARGSVLLGGVSGLADGGLALSARAIHVEAGHLVRLVADPLALAIIPFAIVGVVAFAGALQRGAASAALACQQAVVTVVPSAIGLAVLGDKARRGLLPLTIIAFVLTVTTLVVLTQSSTHRSDLDLFPPG
jgi:hypothetical protein